MGFNVTACRIDVSQKLNDRFLLNIQLNRPDAGKELRVET